jgi:hypothetical protein
MFVLVSNKVPKLIEVMDQICNDLATDFKAHVMPWQSRLRAHDGWEFRVSYFEFIINPYVIILNSWVFRLLSENLVIAVVITAVAHVQAS